MAIHTFEDKGSLGLTGYIFIIWSMYLYHNLRMAIHTFEDQGSLASGGDIFGIWSVYLNLRMATHLGVLNFSISENGDT